MGAGLDHGGSRWGRIIANPLATFSRTIELPRPAKRFISICADALMMPAALWAAMSLKAGYPLLSVAHWLTDWPAYVAVVAVSIPTFVRLGLYRAVIRYLGHKAVFAVAFAVALSGSPARHSRHAVRTAARCRGASWRSIPAWRFSTSRARVSWCATTF